MIEPSDRDIKKEKQSELDKIAETNAKCVAGYQVIRNTVFNNISDGDLTKMNKYIKAEYGKVYTGLKGMIIDALNDAKDKNVKLVEKLLDESLPPARHYEVLPKTAPFKYTNRVFTEKSVSVRSQKAADAITKIIADGRNYGLAIKDIQKKVDIVMGFRDAQGRLTDKSKKLIESGKFAHRNGSIYETYRIARTEVMRMNAFAKYDQFDELRQRYPNARLKLLATLDNRTREQSREMNGQISNAKGEFLYPDSKYYRLGTAPAQWCINDRETCTIVFLTNKEAKENREELRELKEELDNTVQFKNVESINEAETFAKDLGIEKVEYKGLDLQVVNTMNEVFAEYKNKYPEIISAMKYSGSMQNRYAYLKNNIYTKQRCLDELKKLNPNLDEKTLLPYAEKRQRSYLSNYKVSKDVYAVSTNQKDTKGVLFNANWTYEKTLQSYKNDVANNWHPIGTDKDIKSIIHHELGHELDKLLDIRNKPELQKLFNSFTEKEITEKLSTYAWNNKFKNYKTSEKFAEFIAEAWSEYKTSAQPRTIALQIGEMIEDAYKKYKN